MLGKLLLLALAVWMILLLLKHYRRSLDAPQTKAKPEAQDMVACQACGVHLPKSESILKKGAYYCSKEQSEQAGQ